MQNDEVAFVTLGAMCRSPVDEQHQLVTVAMTGNTRLNTGQQRSARHF
jgi:hypothetical protein